MATLARSDAFSALLWLGLVVALILQLALPQPPQVSVEDMPQPQETAPQPAAQEEAKDPPAQAASDLRRVTLPPPPRLASAAPAMIPEPAAKSTTTAVEPAPPAPAPPKVVTPLRSQPPRLAERRPRAMVPLRAAPQPQAAKPVPEGPDVPAPAPPPPVVRPLPPAEAQPEPKAQPQPVKSSDPAPQKASAENEATTVTVSQSEAKQGRTLLRLLEHGSGPEIELAWPDSSAKRRRLYGLLHGCFGMQVGVMDASGRLFRAEGATRVAWTPNLDRYSGFLRSPSGRLAPEEERIVRVAGVGLSSAAAVRLFPRRVDALLLGGLHALIGPDYPRLRTIHARYRLKGRRVLIESVTGDGRAYPGTIDLTPAAQRACTHASS